MEKPILQDSPSFVDLCTLHQHAMRYYRLWIYACNIVLAVATLVFTVFAVSVAVDPRLSLLSGVEPYQPTFLYAYVALTFQFGILQAIGCVGALRLNPRLLNIYWMILLVLTIGDLLTGLIWAFRLEHIKSNLRPMLKQKLVSLYGKDEDFTEVWDWVQINDMCCGVDGPIDFQRINESTFGAVDTNSLANDTWSTYLLHQQERLQNQQTIPKLPSTCCIFTVTHNTPTTPETPISSEVSGGGAGGGPSRSRSHHKGRGGGNNGGGTSKGDRWNDPMSQKPLPGEYYQQPQQLKGSFQNSNNYNNNNYNSDNYQQNTGLSYPDNYINTYSNSYNSNSNNGSQSTSATSSVMSNNLVVSDLRQSPMTDQNLGVPASAMGYFGPVAPVPHPMGGSSHNRRKIAHAKNKHYEDIGYGERNRWGVRVPVTTTEGPPAGRPSPATIGVCVLPNNLRQSHSTSSSSSSNSADSSSSSFEDSSEGFSTTSLPPSYSTTPSTTSASTIMPNNESTSSTILSTTDVPPVSSTSVPPPTSPHPRLNRGSMPSSSSNNNQHHRRHHHPTPFLVSMEQHTDGCADKILEWVEHSSDVLFVIGFCIIVFLKGCFITILRYEIKEMIEKIKLLNGDDPGRTAAMNELIGLTSMYETGNDENGETEGLMSGVNNSNQDTNTNLDTIDGDNGSGGGIGMTSGGTTGDATRKDSGSYVRENHLIGNNVGPPRYIGNHVGSLGSASTAVTDDYPRMLGVNRISMAGGTDVGVGSGVPTQHDLDNFIDSRSALLSNKQCSGNADNQLLIGNNKHYLNYQHLHRNENGGRTVPRNGNNNNSDVGSTVVTATTGSFENPPVGVPLSASAPSIPIDAIARVTNAPIH